MRGCQNPPAVFDIALGIAYSLAMLWMLCGTLYRVLIWICATSRFSIPLSPAPRSLIGVAGRLSLELLVFRSLARACRTIWLASLLFHYALLWVLIVHLRFVFESLPLSLILFIQFSGWASAAMVLGLTILLVRRLLVDRIRYVSALSDHLHLILLLSIAVSGVALKRLWPTSLYEVGEFLRGAMTLSWVSLPDNAGLVLHLLLVLILLLVYPISKLVHGFGIVFAPTFNQIDRS